MNRKIYFTFMMVLVSQLITAQVVLDANGPGNTYEEINAVLAPGYDAVEVPDCAHPDFGRHIEEIFDSELGIPVFKFIAHVSPDNDRCKKFDRQRVEIKTYGPSPDNLKASLDETVRYTWKFKLPKDFKVSTSFTHIHQIKSVGGPYESIPMITLTARKANPDRLELRYTATNNQTTIASVELDALRGHWVEVTELITFGNNGSYAMEINTISNNKSILSYSNNDMDTWQDGADFARPKWGIYRSLNKSHDLQDEIVLFANFSIEEIELQLPIEELKDKAEELSVIPNPITDSVIIKNLKIEAHDSIELYDANGKQIPLKKRLTRKKIDFSNLHSGTYYLVFRKNLSASRVLKCVVK